MAPTDPSATTARLTPSGWPIRGVFFVNGLVCASYIASMPALKRAHGLDEASMGVLGAVFALAALLAMQVAGRVGWAHGRVALLRGTVVMLPVVLVVVALAPGFTTLMAASAALGAVHGATDAAMNAQAVDVERLRGRRLLSSCHGAWSASAVIASVSVGALVALGLDAVGRSAVIAGVGLAGGLIVGRRLRVQTPRVQTPSGTESAATGTGSAGRPVWSRTVIVLGLVATALMMCEGGALGWGAILLHDARGASLGLSAIAVGGFSLGQVAGRDVGDRLAQRWGAGPVVAAGGTAGTAGLAIAVLSPQPGAAAAGFAAAGLGLSVILPLLVSEVGRSAPGDPSAVVARFTTFIYGGILLGPVLIGLTAGVVGLVVTMAALVPLLAVTTVVARLQLADASADAGRRSGTARSARADDVTSIPSVTEEGA
jgi:MFS family permease